MTPCPAAGRFSRRGERPRCRARRRGAALRQHRFSCLAARGWIAAPAGAGSRRRHRPGADRGPLSSQRRRVEDGRPGCSGASAHGRPQPAGATAVHRRRRPGRACRRRPGRGLCMPHSPRLHDGALWAEFGAGELLRIRPGGATGRRLFCSLPGFAAAWTSSGRMPWWGWVRPREATPPGLRSWIGTAAGVRGGRGQHPRRPARSSACWIYRGLCRTVRRAISAGRVRPMLVTPSTSGRHGVVAPGQSFWFRRTPAAAETVVAGPMTCRLYLPFLPTISSACMELPIEIRTNPGKSVRKSIRPRLESSGPDGARRDVSRARRRS